MMKYLGILVVLALLLVPTSRAVAPAKPDGSQDQATCDAIVCYVIHFGPHPGGVWDVEVLGAHGPWLLYYGTGESATTYYKGCPFGPTPPIQFGPFTGSLSETVPDSTDMSGYWQAISSSQTSPTFHAHL
jgi:hypothetical protein